jgi:ABC-type lipopolysaccharide export system ATPase subunit
MTQTAGSAGPQCAIQVRGLCKRYRGRTAVDGVDLQIGRGEVFALLGPNGACAKLGVAGRTAAVTKAMEIGALPPPGGA